MSVAVEPGVDGGIALLNSLMSFGVNTGYLTNQMSNRLGCRNQGTIIHPE